MSKKKPKVIKDDKDTFITLYALYGERLNGMSVSVNGRSGFVWGVSNYLGDDYDDYSWLGGGKKSCTCFLVSIRWEKYFNGNFRGSFWLKKCEKHKKHHNNSKSQKEFIFKILEFDIK